MIVREITRIDDFEALRPAWQALWARDPAATPFQSPAWLIPWWRHVGRGDLWTLEVRDDTGQMTGLLPLYVYTDPATLRRQVFLLGIATTDYLDGIFAEGLGRDAAAAALAYLDEHGDRWDVCDLQQLRPGSPLCEAPAPAGWSEERSLGVPCPVLELPGSAGAPAQRLPEGLSRCLRRSQRQAERLGQVQIDQAHEGSWEELLDALIGLHTARFRAKGAPGVLSDGGVRRAHRESVPALLAIGALRMYGLRLSGKVIAVFYGMADRPDQPERRVYGYLSGLDPAYPMISPGTLLIGHAVERAVDEGASAFDFLRGREGYKYRFGARDTLLYRRRMTRGPRDELTEGGAT